MKKLLLLLIFYLYSVFSFANENIEIKVLYFHNKMRCATCIAIESIARQTVEEFNSKKSGKTKISFGVVDISKKENEKLYDKYKITYSSLLIIKKEGEKDIVKNLTKQAFANARRNPNLLKCVIYDSIKSSDFKEDKK